MIDDLGIKCRLNFSGIDQSEERILIKKNLKLPFHGNVEYKSRMIHIDQYHKKCPRLNEEASNLYFSALEKTHENLRNIRSKNRTYLNSQGSYHFPKNLNYNIN